MASQPGNAGDEAVKLYWKLLPCPCIPCTDQAFPSSVTFSPDANQQHRSIQCSEPRVLPGFQTIRVHAPTPSGFKSPSPLFPTCFCWGCRDRDPNRGVRHPPRLHGVRCRLAEFRSAPWWRGGEVQSGRGLAVRSIGRSVAMLFLGFHLNLNLEISGCPERNEQMKQVVLRISSHRLRRASSGLR